MTEILEGSFLKVPIPGQFWLTITMARQIQLLNGAAFTDEETALVLKLLGRLH